MLTQILVFLIGTFIFTIISYRSIRQPGTHGYYRFFAWESMLLLYLLVTPVWYHDLNAIHQSIAGGLFLISLFLFIAGVIQLRLFGQPDKQRNDVPMVYFEKTTVLVKTGIYRFIRHPLYSSLFFLCWGFFFKSPTIAGAAIATVASLFLILTMRVEEVECMRYFGNQYRDYMQHSKMFIPFIW